MMKTLADELRHFLETAHGLENDEHRRAALPDHARAFVEEITLPLVTPSYDIALSGQQMIEAARKYGNAAVYRALKQDDEMFKIFLDRLRNFAKAIEKAKPATVVALKGREVDTTPVIAPEI